MSHVTTTLPKPWEEEATFQDSLYDWINSAPWLLISLAAHAVVFFIIQAIPWTLFEPSEETIIIATIETQQEEEFLEPPDEVVEIIETTENNEDVIIDTPITETEASLTDADDSQIPEGNPDQIAESPMDSLSDNNILGIGGPPGGKYGKRFGRGRGGPPGSGGVNIALESGLAWLAAHQSPSGGWNVDEFMHDHEPDQLGAPTCDCGGPGQANQDIGVTGLCVLTFLGAGHTTRAGAYADVVKRGVKYLRENQDYATGLVGEDLGHSYVYDHSIATLALSEAYYFSKSPTLGRSVKRAVRFIEKARNPYGAWRYDVPPLGDNDTSVTAWMVLALASAKEAGINIDREAMTGALGWIDEVTDSATGRVGYDELGSSSSRVPGHNDHFPIETGEAMTAAGLLCRFFVGQDPSDTPAMEQHADLLLQSLPEWDPEGFGCDMYYWYYGSYAMFQMGGKHWDKWNKAMKSAVIDSQRQDGHQKGSWDPVGPWGYSGGRVYSTAMMVLCLEVYFRYSRVIGGR